MNGMAQNTQQLLTVVWYGMTYMVQTDRLVGWLADCLANDRHIETVSHRGIE